MRPVRFLFVPVFAPPALAAAQMTTTLSLGTATPGGGFTVYGAAFADPRHGACMKTLGAVLANPDLAARWRAPRRQARCFLKNATVRSQASFAAGSL